MNQKDPFKNLVLDKEEQEIEAAIERGEYVSTPDFKERKKAFQEAAQRYNELKQAKRITIRVKQEDLIRVKAKAKQRGIPYQTLLNALIRQYAEGHIQIVL